MPTRTGKILYLSMWDGKPKWDFNPENACYWDDEDKAQKFGDNWFKECKAWKVVEAVVDLNEVIRRQG